jgi:hypothetical protein
VPRWAEALHNLLGFYGFLVPISVGIGARLFPLHFGARLPGLALLRTGLAILLVGLGLRVVAEMAGMRAATTFGLAAVAAALVLFVGGSRCSPRGVQSQAGGGHGMQSRPSDSGTLRLSGSRWMRCYSPSPRSRCGFRILARSC